MHVSYAELTWKRALLALGCLGLIFALIAAVVVADEHEDRRRPMYKDRITMEQIQFDLLEDGSNGVVVTVGPDAATVDVGGTPFQPSPGVRVTVEQEGDEYCVRADNQYGDVTMWACVDGTGSRPSLGTLAE